MGVIAARAAFAMALLACVASAARAAESFEFTRIAACDDEHDPYGPDRLVAERENERLVVTGWAGVTCGVVPVDPEVVPDWGTLTLKLAFKTDGPVATCRCTTKFQFTLFENVPAGRTIYLIKDGNGAAHATAP
ncbi:hypothetical protein [Pseudoxanthomonas sp.]|uniref:hypothetical protein n=1 Tax=Pseudoxanthomonas sp. TaxID=1871049 RepID=UPI0028C3ACDC|nr:hypothetical protein [Pseudoxanthomonas sp.]